MTQAPTVLSPASSDEAVAAFGDGSGITLIGGGTIVVPELTDGRRVAATAILLGNAGLGGISRDGSGVTIGATTPIADLVGLPAPIGPCASGIADGEIRSQATLAGNLCAGEGSEVPRGDLQGALLAVGATVRSAGANGVTEESLEDFLPKRGSRLVLSVSYEEPQSGAFSAYDRPHTHDYTALAVSAARLADGSTRIAVTGAAWHGVRLPSAEANASDPSAAGAAAVADVSPHDDALASAWYRGRILPVLVTRALTELQGGA